MLVDRCADASVFQTYEWQLTWWKHYGRGSPYVLIASVDSAAVAVLSLYMSDERLPLGRTLRRIRPIGVGGDTSPDYLGQVAMPEYAASTAAAFLDYLFDHSSDWEVLELTDLAETSPVLAELRQRRLPSGYSLEISEPNRIFFTDLPDTWERYLGALSSHARYSVRNVRRKFLACPESRLFEWTDGARLDSAIDQLIELHTERWRGRTERHSFSTATYNAFHRELMHEFMRKGWLRLYCMELSGRLIGVFYGYSFRRTLYHFQGGFDPAHEKLRIGQCLMAFAIEKAIGDGCNCLDMLRGEYEYKKRWAPSVRRTFSCRIMRPTASAYLSEFIHRVALPMRSRVVRLLQRVAGRAR